jgi:hypothetical protein
MIPPIEDGFVRLAESFPTHSLPNGGNLFAAGPPELGNIHTIERRRQRQHSNIMLQQARQPYCGCRRSRRMRSHTPSPQDWSFGSRTVNSYIEFLPCLDEALTLLHGLRTKMRNIRTWLPLPLPATLSFVSGIGSALPHSQYLPVFANSDGADDTRHPGHIAVSSCLVLPSSSSSLSQDIKDCAPSAVIDEVQT